MAFEDSEIHPMDCLREMQRVRTHQLPQIPSSNPFPCSLPLPSPHSLQKGELFGTINEGERQGELGADFTSPRTSSSQNSKVHLFARQNSDPFGKLMRRFNANTMFRSTTPSPRHLPGLHILLKQSVARTPQLLT